MNVKALIRTVPDFPKPGILFKDITPVLANPSLLAQTIDGMIEATGITQVDKVVGIDARGFIFGALIAERLGAGFIPVRKKGKLPYRTVSYKYDLEYGSAEIEMHIDSVKPGMRVLVHDDLLATGGTAAAAAELMFGKGAEHPDYLYLFIGSFIGIVAGYGGHGIGRAMHAEPHVPHWGRRGEGLRLRPGMAITIEMLSAHVSGAPVVDHDGTYVGFISEVDILKALAAGQDLTALTAEQLMVHNPIAVHRSTPIAEAIKIMADKHLLNLPVEEDGTVTYSVTRHDLLRASIGLAVAIED